MQKQDILIENMFVIINLQSKQTDKTDTKKKKTKKLVTNFSDHSYIYIYINKHHTLFSFVSFRSLQRHQQNNNNNNIN